MHVLGAFLNAWADARSTFGEDAPDSATRFDGSNALRELRSRVQSAAPEPWWAGAGSAAYSAANAQHARALGDLAVLEQRIAAEVDRSAELVDASRGELDAVRQWVLDVAASAPQDVTGEQLLISAVGRGIRDVADIVSRSNGQLSEIGQRIGVITGEYRALTGQVVGIGEAP